MRQATQRGSDIIRAHLLESAAVKHRAVECCTDSITEAAAPIANSFRTGGKLLMCGNGGSAADCQHVAAEFTSRLTADFVRPGLPAIALTTDTSFLTAYANDFEFDGIFERQVEALGKPGDVLLAISTSGASPNVLKAVERAKTMGMKVVGLTGGGGAENSRHGDPPGPPLQRGGMAGAGGQNRLKEMVDVCICIPSDNTQHIQEAHIAVLHVICHLVERAVFETEMKKSE